MFNKLGKAPVSFIRSVASVLIVFLCTGLFFSQVIFAQGFKLIAESAINLPMATVHQLPFILSPRLIERYDGYLRPLVFNQDRFYLTGASFYWPGEGKNSREHMGSVLTPGISVANLDLPLGTVLELYDPNTGAFMSRKVVADRGPFGVEQIDIPLIGADERQVQENGRPVFKRVTMPRRDDDGNLIRNQRRGIDIQVASKQEALDKGEIPVLLKILWQPGQPTTAAQEELPKQILDERGFIKAPFEGMRVLDVRANRVVLEDELGRLLVISDLDRVMVKVADRLSKGDLIGESGNDTLAALLVNGVKCPIESLLKANQLDTTPSNKSTPIKMAVGDYKFIRKEWIAAAGLV